MSSFDTPQENVFDGLDAHGKRLARPWVLTAHSIDAHPDITVRFQSNCKTETEFSNLQQAVDHAVKAGAKPDGPTVIDIGPGFFEGPVIQPLNAQPMKLRGAGAEVKV